MTTYAFDQGAFTAQFPELGECATNTAMASAWVTATVFIAPYDTCSLNGPSLVQILNLLTAHLVRLASINAGDGVTGVVTAASEGSVSISLDPPKSNDAFQWWLSTTPYGLQLRALLSLLAVGGTLIGGSFERASFRGAGGYFGPGIFL